MSNLKENNLYNLRLFINRDEYWDFFVNKDNFNSYAFRGKMYDDCLISYIDASIPECVPNDKWLYGLSGYSWDCATSIGYTLYDISYTGLDNGLFRFKKDRISNEEFWNMYQGKKYSKLRCDDEEGIFGPNNFKLDEGDYRLKLHTVSGNTQQYEYPLTVEENQIKLNGGFYQGFFETEKEKYRILPNKIITEEPWEFEFVLKKSNLEAESNKTLNDKYPDNKGIFFYIGTRAENKWVYLYDKREEFQTCSMVIDPFKDFDDIFSDITNECFVDDPVDFEDFSSCTECSSGKSVTEDEEEFDVDFDETDNVEEDVTVSSETDNKVCLPNYTFFRGCRCKSCGCIDNYQTDNSKDFLSGDCLYDTDYVEPEMDISNFDFQTENGFSLKTANDSFIETDNKFLLFNRTCTGFTTNNWVDGTSVLFHNKRKEFKDNLFMLMNRTCTGYTTENIDELREAYLNNYDYSDFYNDLYNNALAFRIKDDGSIGYRLLTIDCEISGCDKTSIEEGYSYSGEIKDDEWVNIHVKIVPSETTMKMFFYVNGKLIYITKELPKINLRALNEIYEKQEGVPFNISIGGGTQGLAETILPNYMQNPIFVYPLEKNFAGSFIGYFKSFKFYNCKVEYMNIWNNFKFERKKWLI